MRTFAPAWALQGAPPQNSAGPRTWPFGRKEGAETRGDVGRMGGERCAGRPPPAGLDAVTYLHHHGPSDENEQIPWYRGEVRALGALGRQWRAVVPRQGAVRRGSGAQPRCRAPLPLTAPRAAAPQEWSYMRGGLSTIDRDYGIINKIHHDIGTHVVRRAARHCAPLRRGAAPCARPRQEHWVHGLCARGLCSPGGKRSALTTVWTGGRLARAEPAVPCCAARSRCTTCSPRSRTTTCARPRRRSSPCWASTTGERAQRAQQAQRGTARRLQRAAPPSGPASRSCSAWHLCWAGPACAEGRREALAHAWHPPLPPAPAPGPPHAVSPSPAPAGSPPTCSSRWRAPSTATTLCRTRATLCSTSRTPTSRSPRTCLRSCEALSPRPRPAPAHPGCPALPSAPLVSLAPLARGPSSPVRACPRFSAQASKQRC